MAEQMMQEAAGKTIPAGYKQTEVGVIPEDWDIASLGSLLKETPRYGINAPAVPLTGDTPVYIRITDISDDGYFSPGEKVGVNSPLSGMYFLSAGDIVLARTGASVGKSYLYNKNDGQLVYAGFLIKVSPNQERLSSMFLSQYLKSHQYWNWVVVNSMRSGQPGINGSEYANLLIPTPTIEEQTAIANVLSDSDALIDALEQLIAKKQAIKSATMQQLLTGRTRLPAFALRPDGTPKGYKPSELGDIPEDWEVKQIGNVAPLQRGFDLPANMRIDGRYPVVYSNGVVNTHNTYKVNGPGVVTGRSGTLGKVHYVEHDFWPHNTSLWVMKFNNSDIKFIYYLFSFIGFERFASGSGVPTLNRNDAHLFKISIPTLLKEQTAIATILSDMDNELQALTQKLEKARALKQGMMQQLLTGKIRLPLAAGA